MDKNPLEYRAQHTALDDDTLPAIEPTKEGETFRGDDGKVCAPLYTIDVLASLLRNGTISREQYEAGRHFETTFIIASLNELRASSLENRIGMSPEELSKKVYSCRDAIRVAFIEIGGLTQVGGQVVWEVLGMGRSLRDATEQLSLAGKKIPNSHYAGGVLAASLCVLARHYGKLDPSDLKIPGFENEDMLTIRRRVAANA